MPWKHQNAQNTKGPDTSLANSGPIWPVYKSVSNEYDLARGTCSFIFFCTALDKLLSVHLLGKPRVMDTSLLLESSELVLPLNQIAPAKGQFPHQTNQICLHTGFTLLCTIESETEGRKVPGHRRSGQSPSVKKYLVPQSQQIPDLFKNHVWHLSEDRSQNASSSAFQLGMLSNAKAASKSGNSTRTTS